MRQFNFPILHVLIALCAGVVVYDFFSFSNSYLFTIALGLLFILCVLHYSARKKDFSELPFIIGIFLLFLTLGYLTRVRSDDLKNPFHYTHSIQTQPQSILFSIDEQLKPTPYQDKYVGTIQRLDGLESSGKILINIDKDSSNTSPKVGDWLHTYTSILSLPKPKNPYQFDYGNYLKRRQIYAQLSLKRSELLTSKNTSTGLGVWSSRFRESIQKSLRYYPFSKRQLAIMEALLLGQKQGIDKEMSVQYAAAGMMHILAVSGLHVGIVLLILRFLTRSISDRKLRFLRSAIIITLIWGFAFFTGLSPSVLRAATMFSFLEIGASLGGKRKTFDAVIASAVFLVLYDPFILYQVGFQLSYLAVIAILWIQPLLYRYYEPSFFLDKILWGTATVTVAAQIGVLPLSLFYFHQFPGLFFVSNIVILPFLTLILSGGILVTFLAAIGYLPDIMVTSYGAIIDLMNNFIGWVASQENFVSSHISLSIWLLILSYFVFITLVCLLKRFTFVRLFISGISIALFTGFWMYEKSHPTQSHLSIINKSKTTRLIYYKNNSLTIYDNDVLLDIETDYQINAYRDALSITDISVDTMQNYFYFNHKEVLVIDSLGIYNVPLASPDFILLTQSPKVHLNRLITRYPKATIIADASNYRSYVDRWRATCRKQKIPFHSTYEKGAFILQ